MMDKDNQSEFEAQLHALQPSPAGTNLQQRIRRSVMRRRLITTASLTGAAAIVCLLLFWSQQPVSLPAVEAIETVDTQPSTSPADLQQIVLAASKPRLIQLPDQSAVWEIRLEIANHSTFESQTGSEQNIFTNETRSVFVPAVFR